MLAQVVFTKYVELNENAFLFIDYFQLHITWDSLLPDMPYNLDQYFFICGEGPGLCFLFPICSRLTLLSNVIMINYYRNEMKKQRIQNTSLFSNFIEQTQNNSIKLLSEFLNAYSQFLPQTSKSLQTGTSPQTTLRVALVQMGIARGMEAQEN